MVDRYGGNILAAVIRAPAFKICECLKEFVGNTS